MGAKRATKNLPAFSKWLTEYTTSLVYLVAEFGDSQVSRLEKTGRLYQQVYAICCHKSTSLVMLATDKFTAKKTYR